MYKLEVVFNIRKNNLLVLEELFNIGILSSKIPFSENKTINVNLYLNSLKLHNYFSQYIEKNISINKISEIGINLKMDLFEIFIPLTSISFIEIDVSSHYNKLRNFLGNYDD